LIPPVIRECERWSLLEISRAAHRLVAKSSRGGFTPDELSGATFSISNMGMLGIEHFAAVIVPPQAAILAVSAIKDRPVVRGGQLAVGRTLLVTGSFDHRIVDGVVADSRRHRSASSKIPPACCCERVGRTEPSFR
jgi:pyruvate dehydrogenase E2 component (dihydrolipoamide acetyltransferase)